MCGIFGWIGAAKACPEAGELERLTNLMVHRGPDASGQVRVPLGDGSTIGALGHRRLSIIDLSEGGAQPMWDATGRVCVSFNGEIYNYIELKAELEALGHRFRSSSDTEVLIEAYRAWGTGAFKRFRGMYAFGLLDLDRGSLILARDAFGKKPLFIRRTADQLAFASEIEPLLGLPGAERRLSHRALVGYLLNRYVPWPDTFFEGIEKLPGGTWAEWRDGRLTVERHYTPPLATTTPDITDYEEAVERFAATFDEAVRLRLRSDAPFGAFLSGGLDSSAVVAAMSRHMSTPVSTFAVDFAEAKFSEGHYADQVAKYFGTRHSRLEVGPEDFFANWSEALQHRGAPVSEASDIPIMLLAKHAGKSVKMVLTGEGADEFLAGYPKYSAERFAGLYQSVVPSGLHQRLLKPLIDRLPYGARRFGIMAKAFGTYDDVDRLRIWFGDFGCDDIEHLFGRPTDTRPGNDFPFLKGTTPLRRILYFDQTSWLPDNTLERNDRMMMAGSVEGRMPFMDQELAALCARFPDEFLVGAKRGKRILRRAMRNIVPDVIIDRRKNGFRVPISEWFRSSHKAVPLDLLCSEASQVRRLLVPAELDRLVHDHIEGRRNNERPLWTMCNLELFLRIYRPTF